MVGACVRNSRQFIWKIRRGADKSSVFLFPYLQHNQKNFSWMD
jgi:hypothetical protein